MRDFSQSRSPSFRLTLDLGLWTLDFNEPIYASDPLVIQPAIIAHPAGIHRIVLARLISWKGSWRRQQARVRGAGPHLASHLQNGRGDAALLHGLWPAPAARPG